MTPASTPPIPVAILVRVSTAKQETDRQVHELEEHARQRGYTVTEVCCEQVTGNARQEDRDGIQRVLELAHAGSIKKVLVHEVSRVARRNSVAHAFIEELEELGVSLYWHAQNIETLLANGKRNPAASVMFALLAELARNEREVLGERIRSGLAEAARKGRYPGRPKGTVEATEDFLGKHRAVVRQLRAGQSVRAAAKIAGCSKNTVAKVRQLAIAAGLLEMP